jgi:hypothetical protein
MTCFSNAMKAALLTFMFTFFLWAFPVNAQTENPTSVSPTQQTDESSDGGWHVGITPYNLVRGNAWNRWC